MSGEEISKIRNIAIVAHGGAGKTTLTEAMLFDAGATSRLGRVEDGTTVTDFDEDETKRRMSVSSALAFCEWKGYKLNLIDTPGASIFLSDTRNCLRVVDGALVVVSSVSGVKVQTEKVWAYAEADGLARIIYINKMDQEQADFSRALEDIRKNLCATATPIQLPIGAHASFAGVIDLLRMKALIYQDERTGKYSEGEIPSDLRPKVEQCRTALVEAVADSDDRLLEKYLEVGVLSYEELKAGLRRAVTGGRIAPVLCGSALQNIGVHSLLDLLTELVPSPADRDPSRGRIREAVSVLSENVEMTLHCRHWSLRHSSILMRVRLTCSASTPARFPPIPVSTMPPRALRKGSAKSCCFVVKIRFRFRQLAPGIWGR